MSSRFLVRNLMLVAAVLLLALPLGASVSAREDFTAIAFQDFGDDDGDGIPNELDPDDDNDGIVDQEDESPSPAEPTPVATVTPETPDDDVNEPSTPVDPAPQQPEVAVVSSLPETGVGATSPGYVTLAVTALVIGGAWALRFRYHEK